MTKEDKQLLLKDLCARLPYGVKATFGEKYGFVIDGITIESDGIYVWLEGGNYPLGQVKPYLRPMSSMTSDERIELSIILSCEFYVDDDFALVAEDDRHRIRLELCEGCIDWLLAHHFDYRGLIEKGLALEAPEDMYKTE